ncbi:MAG TPA: exodeoxyribonuclease VII small subunit [Bacteroidota bacterium]|nr:exodeoxyribonuclease VII small subunit [Bacteroidota bacterium]
MSKKSTKQSFEDNLHRLEEIVESLEKGDVPLDQALNLYEEGIRLSRSCAERLKEAELRIKKLGKDAKGQFELTDLREE